MTFKALNLSQEILLALEKASYKEPTLIQERAIPKILAEHDIFACAQTGTGKTAAFTLPIIQKFQTSGFAKCGSFRALILVPTRELAEQVNDNIKIYTKYARISHTKVFGGVSARPQIRALEKGVDILVATPGRLLDLFNQKKLSFSAVEIAVLDEADRMLDMGFIKDIRKIFSKLPFQRQTLLFSATMTDAVKELAKSIVKDPVEISVSPDKPAVEKIEQKLYFVDEADKINLLKYLVDKRLENDASARALVFCRTKHGANKVAKKLSGEKYEAEAIHSNKSQSARRRALDDFKAGRCMVLVATDIAARGIDVKNMGLVVNYDLPEEAETYVHRIGRTARAQQSGEAISFFCPSDKFLLRAIERFIKKSVPIAKEENPFESQDACDVYYGKKKCVPRKRGGSLNLNGNPNGRRGFEQRRAARASKSAAEMRKSDRKKIPGNFPKQKKQKKNRGGR